MHKYPTEGAGGEAATETRRQQQHQRQQQQQQHPQQQHHGKQQQQQLEMFNSISLNLLAESPGNGNFPDFSDAKVFISGL